MWHRSLARLHRVKEIKKVNSTEKQTKGIIKQQRETTHILSLKCNLIFGSLLNPNVWEEVGVSEILSDWKPIGSVFSRRRKSLQKKHTDFREDGLFD